MFSSKTYRSEYCFYDFETMTRMCLTDGGSIEHLFINEEGTLCVSSNINYCLSVAVNNAYYKFIDEKANLILLGD